MFDDSLRLCQTNFRGNFFVNEENISNPVKCFWLWFDIDNTELSANPYYDLY